MRKVVEFSGGLVRICFLWCWKRRAALYQFLFRREGAERRVRVATREEVGAGPHSPLRLAFCLALLDSFDKGIQIGFYELAFVSRCLRSDQMKRRCGGALGGDVDEIRDCAVLFLRPRDFAGIFGISARIGFRAGWRWGCGPKISVESEPLSSRKVAGASRPSIFSLTGLGGSRANSLALLHPGHLLSKPLQNGSDQCIQGQASRREGASRAAQPIAASCALFRGWVRSEEGSDNLCTSPPVSFSFCCVVGCQGVRQGWNGHFEHARIDRQLVRAHPSLGSLPQRQHRGPHHGQAQARHRPEW